MNRYTRIQYSGTVALWTVAVLASACWSGSAVGAEAEFVGVLALAIEESVAKELELSGKLLVEAIHLARQNKLKPIAQSEPLGKYEPVLTKAERILILEKVRKGIGGRPKTGSMRQETKTSNTKQL